MQDTNRELKNLNSHKKKMADMEVKIRRVQNGDEAALAYIQTESWKAAFKDILDPEALTRCTDIDRAEVMYKGLLEDKKGNGYILTLDDVPHCIAWWDAARDADMQGKAELICIHSLSSNWRQGYGSMMMDQVLADIKAAGYGEVMLWVFSENTRARKFYEAKRFHVTEYEKPILGKTEICYLKEL
ncbi:MAG: GNAT family N-acetyltransferase [Flexilinea sp.]|nr:GNAT family N-acetyltransferase [Flexilinea sp.]